MGTEIYYFSGTGNSFFAAREIASLIGAEMKSIPSCLGEERITAGADVVGIVFPVYYGELPMIVADFARRLDGIAGKYVFAVCTYGGAASSSLRMLGRIIRSRGGALSAAYGVHMPQNSFRKPREDKDKIFSGLNARLDFIAKNTKAAARGTYYQKPLMELALIPVFMFIVKPVCRRHFRKVSGLPASAGYDRHKHTVDCTFSVTAQCSGCGTCSKVCPVCNISMENGKPIWLGRCEHCLACYNWCPRKAIRSGITSEYYYRHPGVKLSDIAAQQRGSGKIEEKNSQ